MQTSSPMLDAFQNQNLMGEIYEQEI